MSAAVREAFRGQAGHCAALGSPFMARLMTLLAERLTPGTPVADRILTWQGDPAPEADSLPLRLGGALHALKLEGRALAEVYPPHDVPDDDLWAVVAKALTLHAGHITGWLQSPPQTNEVRRSAALIPALHLLSARFDLPFKLSELGCSAGLNLHADCFRLQTPTGSLGPAGTVALAPDWQGPVPTARRVRVLARQGVDLAPIDPATPDGQLRLLAYLWADQPDRISRTRAAIETARANPAKLFMGDAADWLETQLSAPAEGRTHLIFHTVAWQYFPPGTQHRAAAAIEAAGKSATASAPVAHFAMEADGGKGALLPLRYWPGDVQLVLGRADFHGRWVQWSDINVWPA